MNINRLEISSSGDLHNDHVSGTAQINEASQGTVTDNNIRAIIKEKEHLKPMVQDLGDKISVLGFDGLVDIPDQSTREKIGQLMYQAAVRILQTEFRDETSKYLADQKPAQQVMDELKHGTALFNAENFQHWLSGSFWKNSAQANFEIEARMLYLHRLARLSNNAASNTARSVIIDLLNENDIIRTAVEFNREQLARDQRNTFLVEPQNLGDQLATAKKREAELAPESMEIDEVRQQLKRYIQNGTTMRNLLAIISRQPSSGMAGLSTKYL